MRELDVLLTRYLDTHYDASDEPEKQVFHELLSLPDPELAGYLLAGEYPAGERFAGIVARIRGDARG